MRIDTLTTNRFMMDVFKEELIDFDIKLDKLEFINDSFELNYSYTYNKKSYKSSFIYNLNDDIVGWLGICKLLEDLKTQNSNIMRYKINKDVSYEMKIITNEKLDEERRLLKEIDFIFDQDTIYDLLIKKVKPVSVVSKFSDGRVYSIDEFDMFSPSNTDQKTLIIIRRVLEDIKNNIGLEGLYKDKTILAMSDIMNQLLLHNMGHLTDLLKKYDITVVRYHNSTFINRATTSVLKIED